MGSRYRATCTGLIAWLLLAAPAHGQTSARPDSLRGRLLELGVLGEDPFAPEQVAVLGSLIALEVATAPLGTSTGAFTFTFDSGLNTFRRGSSSFGPAFGDRSLTIGKGKLGVGSHWLHAEYGTLGGWNLQNGDFRPTRYIRGAPSLGVIKGTDAGFVSARSNISSDTLVWFLNYGLTSNLDLSVAMPWVRVSLDADIAAFDASGVDLGQGHISLPQSSATGLGDMAIVAKYHFWHHHEGGFAGQLEVRLPTGDTDELRGLGVVRTQASLIWSRGGTVSPHASIGYDAWSDEVTIAPARGVFAKDQWRYAAGVEFTPHARFTVLADLWGRQLLRGGALGYETVILSEAESLETLAGLRHGVSAVSLAPGLKWNPAGNVLVTGSLLVSLTNEGLQARLIPVLGFDWAF